MTKLLAVRPEPPGRALTVMLKVCEWLTSFSPLGEMLMLASTKLLVAAPLPPGPALRLVGRVMVTVPFASWAEAWAVNGAAVGLLMVRVQVAWLPTTVGALQV